MIVNGIDLGSLDGLGDGAETLELPPVVPGRTVHIDADFLAYQTTYEKDGDDKTFEDMKHNAETAVNSLRGLAGAETVHLHLTPSTSNKGGRYELAHLKEYQGNRIEKPKPRYLGIMREWMVKRFPGTLHQFCEADDGMSSAQYAAIERGERHLSIIASKDKDLNMVPGLHVNWSTGQITDTWNEEDEDDFGYVELYDHVMPSGTVKELKGFGQKFFWGQMLIGDSADNISGLPAIPGHVMNFIKPTQAVLKAKAILEDETATDAKREKAEKVIAERKDGQCGPATAILVLDMIDNPRTAYHTIKNIYKRYGEAVGFTHYKTGDPVAWGKAFASEGQLLWMRQQATDANCVLNYWRRCAA
ncbi:hypothetical protein UP09_03340 [Bradyrhizobium sp. LTSP885]|uniref:hypothetical protein n=1 Tax=Bradyrhizobium sp. LTSP885 TaxID=1619232 RepID=UPI0005C9361B|nr:hypothetical protein [Bradyrhizobium sp. LTSP885]KJC51089.1 hypothetical protein UP09_03340 [Bradyrhizobium sp. LTSP885]